jgi:transposase
MPDKQPQLRERVVTFFEKHLTKPKSATVQHFLEEGESRSTIHSILASYRKRKRVERKNGSGRKAKVMTPRKKRWLRDKFESKDGVSLRDAARTLNCHYSHVGRTLKSLGINNYKKIVAPGYTAEQESLLRRQCIRLRRKFEHLHCVQDDEKYITLTGTVYRSFYAPSKREAPQRVKYKPRYKY